MEQGRSESQVRSESPAILRGAAPAADRARRDSLLAEGLIGSPILKIAAEVRALVANGAEVCNLTVGDFAPSEFPVPEVLSRELAAAVQRGETNYPPSAGMPALRKAIAEFCERRLGLPTATENVLVASGARPLIYAAYRILADPGEKVVFPVPSWNNVHYCQMSGAAPVAISCDASAGFLPTAAQLRNKLRDARLLVLNSPVNPTGTAFTRSQLEDICDLVLEENARRGESARPLYLLYDQVYWMLTFGVEHVHPVALRPEIARYTIYIDAISKSFAATGLRVGWAVGPTPIISQMSDLLTHVGAWAPRPEQVATSVLLGKDDVIDDFHDKMRGEVLARLQSLHDGIVALRQEGFPVDASIPSGAIYLSARFALHGLRTAEGKVLANDDEVRSYLLRSAGLAAVPFSAFGQPDGTGWFRLSVGAVSLEDVRKLLPRVRAALEPLAA
ncbi:MAG TPA: aminotransferase class I/II-fold pyridoxal phosphate-dependent enzyme [Gemmatimonadaceae bacterium]|nr:aminotransferase class I/II-fold pyridoxal phosphate-dependent enzyme [Gemmatimonadaceae bacterium]